MQRVTVLFDNSNIIYWKSIITMSSVWKRTIIYKSKRKSINQEVIWKKTFCQLANRFKSLYIKRPTVRNHAARHRLVRNTSIMHENVQAFPNLREKVQGKKPLVQKKISTWKSIRKHKGQENSFTKTCNASQTYSKTKISHTNAWS